MKIHSLKTGFMVIGLITLSILWTGTGTAFAGDRFHSRQKKQYQRIYNGISQGQITPQEFYRLSKEQWRIAHFKREAKNDGWMDRHEKRRLHRMQDKADRHIYTARHNRGHHRHGLKDSYREPARRGKRKGASHDDRSIVYLEGHISDPEWQFAWRMIDD